MRKQDTSATLSGDFVESSLNISSSVNKGDGFQYYYQKSNLLRIAAMQHSWTRATAISIGRAAIGGGFSFVRHPIYGKEITKKRQKEIDNIMKDVNDIFFKPSKVKYIQDLNSLSSKMYYTANSFVLYGQFSWEKIRERGTGKMIGFDILPGIVMPNVDMYGKFNNPAYYFRPWNSQVVVEYKLNDVVYVTNPGLDASIYGSTDYDSLIYNTIPSDLYASQAYKFQFENINAPYNGVWVVDPSTTPEDYSDFVALLANRYTGIESFGKNPLVIRGQAKFEEHRSRSNDDAPYLEGRRYNQEEISGVSGVSAAKLGITDNASKTNHRELRREFHENTLRPVFQFIEEGIYNQILVEEFGLTEYKLAFNRPDLSTALEEATIIGRYVQNGVLSPDEAREIVGKRPRGDEYGSSYFIPSNGSWVGTNGNVSTPLQTSQAMQPDSVNVTDSTTPVTQEVPVQDGGSKRQFDAMRPPEADVAYRNKSDVIGELEKWKRFEVRKSKGKRSDRDFVVGFVDNESATAVREVLKTLTKSEEITLFFDNLINSIEDLTQE